MPDPSDRTGAAAASGEPQHVPVNAYETEGAFVVVAPLPGVMAEDVSVDIDTSSVSIKASMRTEADKDYVLHEWHYGPYERTIDLPPGFGGDAEATFANGQLALRVTRGEGEANRKVTVIPKP